MSLNGQAMEDCGCGGTRVLRQVTANDFKPCSQRNVRHVEPSGTRRLFGALVLPPVSGNGKARNRRISDAGVRAIAILEGYCEHPYNDTRQNATIGFGHLLHYGPVTPADRRRWGSISLAEAEQLLRRDIEVYADGVRALVKVPVTQSQFDALVSFTFNEGAGGLAGSDALKDLNARRYNRVPDDFLHFDVHDTALQARHRKEGAIFRGKYPTGKPAKYCPN